MKNLLSLWQSFRNVWVMELTSNGFVTTNTVGSNMLAAAMLAELGAVVYYLLS